MLKTVVVDDEFYALEKIKDLVNETNKLNFVKGYENPGKCLEDIRNSIIKPELILLDIEMPGRNGLQLAQRILEINENIDIVFITAYKKYAVDAFEMNALDYILKPVTKERFKKTISRLNIEKKDNKKELLSVVSLGKLKFFYQKEEIKIDWPTLKTEELFLYLLINRGEFVKSSKITENLWTDKIPQKAANNLYTTVYSLRKVFNNLGFKKLILSKRGYYKLNFEKIYWDVLQFENVVKEIINNSEVQLNENKIKQLKDLYKGELLENKDYRWLYSFRAKLKQKYKKSAYNIIDYYEKNDKWEEALEILYKLIEIDYLNVGAHQHLIKIYKKMGEKAKALKHYNKMSNLLQEEFGIKPEIDFTDI